MEKLSLGSGRKKNWINYFNAHLIRRERSVIHRRTSSWQKNLIRAAAGEWEEKGYKAYEV